MVEVDAIRILIATSVLAFAGVADLKWRRAPDLCWWIIGAAGAVLLGYEFLTGRGLDRTTIASLLVAGLLLIAAWTGYWFGLIAGGADAKAIMALAVLLPFPLAAGWQLALPSAFPLVLTVLINGLLLSLLVPVGMTMVNLARGDLQGLHTFVAIRVDVDRVDMGTLWPLEWIEEDGTAQGTRHRVLTPGGVPIDAFDPDAFTGRGEHRVWVTPKVPFLVPLWLGLVAAVLLGDPVNAGLEAVLGS